MKLLSNTRIVKTVAAVALAGFSLSSAFAAPNYVLPPNSPLDSTVLDSASQILDNFNDGLALIELQLAVPTLATSGTAPTDEELYVAVAAAVGLPANAGSEKAIVQAAIAYRPGKLKNIITRVATLHPAAADEAVSAAAELLPDKAGDAAGAAIAGLIAATGQNSNFDSAADDAVLDTTLVFIEEVAKSAVAAATKAAPITTAPQAAYEEIGVAILSAVLTHAATSNAELYLDAVGRGVSSGVKTDGTGASKGAVAAALITSFNTNYAALATKENIVRLSLGLLKKSGDLEIAAVRDAIKGVTILAHDAAIDAAQKAISGVRSGAIIDEATFKAQLTAAEAAEAAAFVGGAGQEKAGNAKLYVQWALTDTDFTALTPTLADKQAVLAAAVGSKFANIGPVVANAILAGVGITAADALSAAIPAGIDLYAGKAVTSAYKAAPPADATASKAILGAAITAAQGAGYHRALADIAVAAAKGDKLNANALVEKAVDAVANGWEEAVAAAIVAVNPATEAAADAQAILKLGADEDGVDIATDIAAFGKTHKKSLFDEALDKYILNPSKARAVLFGAGAVDKTLAVPLLGAALRLKNGMSDTDAVLLNYAISLEKECEAGIRRGYEAAIDARDYPDNVFDLVDHKLITHPADAVYIIQGVVSARPEYAHFAAHAAGYRGHKVASKLGTALIRFAHMRVVDNDDPAAVAAISAGLITGVLEANLGTKEDATVRAGTSGLIKGTLAFVDEITLPTGDVKSGLIGSASTFQQANGDFDTVAAGGVTPAHSKGTAGVVTGAVAQTQRGGAASANLSTLSASVITAAAKAAKSKNHWLAIAQAAAQAAYFVGQFVGNTAFGDPADVTAIVAAFPVAGPATTTQLANAVKVGLELAAAGTVGAGAAGLTETAVKYQHHSGVGLPVTALTNL